MFSIGRTAPAVLGLPQKETGIMPRGFSHALPVRHATLSAARPTMHTGPRFRFRFIAKPFAELKKQQNPTGGKRGLTGDGAYIISCNNIFVYLCIYINAKV